MKKYFVLLGLTLALGLFVSNNAVAQWTSGGGKTWTNDMVGIGTNNPASDIHMVRTNAQVDFKMERPGFTGNGAIARYRMQTGEAGLGGGYIYNIAFRRTAGEVEMVQGMYDPNAGLWRQYNGFNVDTRKFSMSAGVLNAEYLNEGFTLFNGGGAVGIGVSEADAATKLAGAKLGVNGKILATEVEVKLFGNWPDFVFLKDYNLMPLNEVEQFINENGHLPNVPNETQVKENGINLGQMDAILLQKIEELTLHIIDLNKRIAATVSTGIIEVDSGTRRFLPGSLNR